MLSGLPEYLNLIPLQLLGPVLPAKVPALKLFSVSASLTATRSLPPGPLQGPAKKDRHAIFQPLTRSKTRLVKPVEFLATELSNLPSRERSFYAIHPAQPEPAQRGNPFKCAGIVDAISSSRSIMCCLANQELRDRATLL